MTPHTKTEVPRPALPTLADIERRMAELLSLPYQPAPYEPEDEDPTPAFDQPYPPSATPPPQRDPWPSLAPEALHGIVGAVVRTIAPHTEADPAAILLQFLAAFGNIVGPAPRKGNQGSLSRPRQQ
jgi:hypothetical protein